MTGYSTAQVADILGVSPSQVRAYARSGLVSPERGPRNAYRFSFQDIILLRTARELRGAALSPRKVRRALRHLREQLPEGRALSAVAISTEGDRVVVRDRDTVWEPETGQVHFDFDVSELAARVAPLVRRAVDEEVAGREMTADRWFDLAFDLEAVAPEKAREAYRRAIEIDPGHANAHLNLGRLIHESGDAGGAEIHYRQAMAASPADANAAYNLGVALEDQGRTEAAIAAYDRAVRLDPTHPEAHFNLAGLYERAGRGEQALRHLAAYRRLRQG